MSTADTYIRARIDKETKNLASNALKNMGLSISDAIRLLMVRIAKENCLPFEIKVPNSTTKKAMEDHSTRYKSTTNASKTRRQHGKSISYFA